LAPDGGHSAPWFLVSGGSGGIGAAICEQLARRGFRPIVCYHQNQVLAEEVAQRTGGKSVPLDLTRPESIEMALDWLESLPRVAGVVLAGSPPPSLGPFGRITVEELQGQWEVNVLGPQILLAGLVRRCFRKHKSGSVVGILTSAMGDADTPATAGMGAYVIAKYGLAGVLAMAAADYPWLRVRSVKPGYTETRMLEAFDERFLELQRERTTFQTPQQVAELVLQEILT
jgi:NAD(P)-dependent dehydrogenase (short-subunit alcohol dehydrogenase family)